MSLRDGRAGWYVRDRLLDALAAARVVLLGAPGGWGKSTLAEQLLATRHLPAVRVRLTEPTTTAGLLASLRRAAHRAGFGDLAAVVDEQAPDTTLDDVVAHLGARRDIALVVDEAQHLDAAATRWLRSLVDDLPDGSLLIVAGRSLPTALTRRRGPHVRLLTTDELGFDTDELTRLLGDRELAALVHERTRGWATAVVLALRSSDPIGALATPSVVDSILDDALGEHRAGLAVLALLPLLSPATAAAAAGEGAYELLATSGLPLSPSGDWWVLPDAIREVLGRDATLGADAAARVARHYDLAVATSFLVVHGALDALARLLEERHWSTLTDLGTEELEGLIDALGDASLREHPRVLLHAARAAELRDHERRSAWLARGAALANGELTHELEAERIRDLLRMADAVGALAAGEALLALLGPHERTARARTLLSLGIARGFESTPDGLAAAERLLSEARATFALLGERHWEAEALNRLAVMVSYRGRRAELAAEQMAASLALLPSGSREWAIGLTYYSDILDHLGRATEAEATAREAWEVGRRRGDAMIAAYGAWSMAVVCCHRGDLEATRQWLDEVERNPGTWMATASGDEFFLFGCDLLANLGDEQGARRYRERALERAAPRGTTAMVDVLDTRLEAMFGDPRRAIELVDAVAGEPYASGDTAWARELFRALAHKRLGERVDATRTIERVVAELERDGRADLPQRHEALVVQMLADVWPGGPAASVDAPLHVALLGRFAVLRGAEVVTPAPGHPATLVKLVALQGPVTSEQAIDLLWPDADVATGRARLRNLLNRIRARSGDLVTRHGEMLSLGAGVTTDIGRFEAGANHALEAAPHERAGLARLAIGAYGGDLLPGDLYEDWAAGPRERLRRRYLSLIDIVAADTLARNDVDEALRLVDLAIATEPLEEGRYLMAARALVAQGRRAAARDYVQRGVAALAELGLAVGPELAALATEVGLDPGR